MMGGRPRILHRIINKIEHKQCFRCKGWFPLKLFGNCKERWAYYAGLTKKQKKSVEKGYQAMK